MKRSQTSLSVERLLARMNVVSFPPGTALDGSRALHPDGVIFGVVDPLYALRLNCVEELKAMLSPAAGEKVDPTDAGEPAAAAKVDRSGADHPAAGANSDQSAASQPPAKAAS